MNLKTNMHIMYINMLCKLKLPCYKRLYKLIGCSLNLKLFIHVASKFFQLKKVETDHHLSLTRKSTLRKLQSHRLVENCGRILNIRIVGMLITLHVTNEEI